MTCIWTQECDCLCHFPIAEWNGLLRVLYGKIKRNLSLKPMLMNMMFAGERESVLDLDFDGCDSGIEIIRGGVLGVISNIRYTWQPKRI